MDSGSDPVKQRLGIGCMIMKTGGKVKGIFLGDVVLSEFAFQENRPKAYFLSFLSGQKVPKSRRGRTAYHRSHMMIVIIFVRYGT
ncbi:hypothetical protein EG831_09910 [bacterium]|nr:hypothetical protein [bacterium]